MKRKAWPLVLGVIVVGALAGLALGGRPTTLPKVQIPVTAASTLPSDSTLSPSPTVAPSPTASPTTPPTVASTVAPTTTATPATAGG